MIVEALAELKRPAILDGEIVALDDHVGLDGEKRVESEDLESTSSTPWPGSARGEAPSRASSSPGLLDERSYPGAGDVIDRGAVDRHLRVGLSRPTQKGLQRLGCLTVRSSGNYDNVPAPTGVFGDVHTVFEPRSYDRYGYHLGSFQNRLRSKHLKL